ncbi:GNAT family N-acetyltransferase [Alteromonas facilis]|uniref:GNAT family N-acetyltransferase n=1 Tax=Alteromonas facilis TaxID=2048004 RepID=UPI000C2841EC|nr:GNAT family N-acetyltransferase [Alteromonas facilis]
MVHASRDGFFITTEQAKFDMDVIHRFISNSYWAEGMPRALLEKAVKNSWCFAVLTSDNTLIGFARLITDKATFAYLADVFILPDYRGKGLSKWLVDTIVSQPEVKGLRRMMLATYDAHSLYEQYGFKPIERVETLMQIWQPDIYKEKKPE